MLLSLQARSTVCRCSFVAVFSLWNISRQAFANNTQSLTRKICYFPVFHSLRLELITSNVVNVLLTCRHSDVLALPQQLSPVSWRSKQSNNVCSSLRRQLDNVSRLFIDVAHVFWQFTVIAWWQHSRPDQWIPRFTAN